MKQIIWTCSDGGVTIFDPSYNDGRRDKDDTEEKLFARIKPPQGATNIHICEDTDVPSDRTFRRAWTQDSKKAIQVDMPKARIIHMDRIRKVRDEKLKELDVETMKGKDVQTEKQALRDIPQTFDLDKFTTPEDLKKAWPSGL